VGQGDGGRFRYRDRSNKEGAKIVSRLVFRHHDGFPRTGRHLAAGALRQSAAAASAMATFVDGHMLNDELSAMVAHGEVGRFLLLDDAQQIIERFERTNRQP
jgi:hypothetical protein